MGKAPMHKEREHTPNIFPKSHTIIIISFIIRKYKFVSFLIPIQDSKWEHLYVLNDIILCLIVELSPLCISGIWSIINIKINCPLCRVYTREINPKTLFHLILKACRFTIWKAFIHIFISYLYMELIIEPGSHKIASEFNNWSLQDVHKSIDDNRNILRWLPGTETNLWNWGIVINERCCKTYKWSLTNTNYPVEKYEYIRKQNKITLASCTILCIQKPWSSKYNGRHLHAAYWNGPEIERETTTEGCKSPNR